jgi:hypothetical protein
MATKVKSSLVIVVLGILIAGCGVGDVPAGMSEQDAKNAIAKMTPDQKIRAIASSPMNQKDKELKYAEIEAETGVKAKDVLATAPKIGGQ